MALIIAVSSGCSMNNADAAGNKKRERTAAHLFKNVKQRTPVPIEQLQAGSGVMWVLVFGQSNAANSGGEPTGPLENIYSFYDGKTYIGQAPLLGATGRKGSVWTQLAERMLKQGLAEKIVLVPFAIGGTSITYWREGGKFNPRLRDIVARAKQSGGTINLALWQQGEGDYDMSQAEYEQSLLSIYESLRSEGVDPLFFVAQQTRKKKQGPLEQSRKAKDNVAKTHPCTFAGPDNDVLGKEYRHDGVHFSAEGQALVADAWMTKLLEVGAERDLYAGCQP